MKQDSRGKGKGERAGRKLLPASSGRRTEGGDETEAEKYHKGPKFMM